MSTKKKTTKKAAPKKSLSPKEKAYLNDVHEEGDFVETFAENYSLENMGFDPVGDAGHQDEIQMEAAGAKAWNAEMRGWRRVGKEVLARLKKANRPLTMGEAIAVFEADSKNLSKLYANK